MQLDARVDSSVQKFDGIADVTSGGKTAIERSVKAKLLMYAKAGDTVRT
ncbi:hypothetical protein [Plantibacter flavus]|nr:hypothetical protein [Plantibacter flavus]